MKIRPSWVAVMCVLLVVTAGCSGLTGTDDGPPTDATTATPTETTTQQPTTTDSPEQLAPAVTTEGVQDARLLADAHRANVENDSFVSHDRIRRTNESGTAYQNATFSMVNESQWRSTVANTDPAILPEIPATERDTYADGEPVLFRYENDSAVWYSMASIEGQQETLAVPPDQVFENNHYAELYQHGLVYSLASRADEVTNAGNDTVRLTGTANDLTHPVPATNVSFTMTVADNGLVERIRLTYEHANRQTSFERTITFTTNVTDPVQEPDWYTTALNETAANTTA